MGSRFVLYLLLALPIALGAAAHAASCAVKYAALNQSIQGGILHSDDRDAIEKILANPKLSDSAKAGLIYHRTMDARLRKLNPKDAAAVRSIMENVDRKVSTNGEVGGAYNWASKKLRTEIPASLKGTATEYFIRMHEVEHAIQHQVVEGGRPKGTGLLSQWKHVRRSVEEPFQRERGAMIAEWHYLNALPGDFKASLASVVQANPELKDSVKLLLRRCLAASNIRSAEDYLELQYGSGRYTLEGIKQDQLKKTKQVADKIRAQAAQDFTEIAPYLGSAGVVAPVLISCGRMLGSKNGSARERTVCSRFVSQVKSFSGQK